MLYLALVFLFFIPANRKLGFLPPAAGATPAAPQAIVRLASLVPGQIERRLVEALLARYKVALLSNCNEMHWRFIRPQIPVVERFCDRVLSYELGLAKPDPEIFRAALRRVGNPPPDTCAFFDDMPTFVQVARTLGIRAEVFTDAANFRGQLARLGLAP